MEFILQVNLDIIGVILGNDIMVLGVEVVLKVVGCNDVIVVGFDGSDYVCDFIINKGNIKVIVFQSGWV